MRTITVYLGILIVCFMSIGNAKAQANGTAVLEPNNTISIDIGSSLVSTYEADIASFGWLDENDAIANCAPWERNYIDIVIYFPLSTAIILLKTDDPATAGWTLQDWDDYLSDPNSN